ncbi:DUF551 domain-containing protein [Salmonella enterica]|uniref:DUF551 domain-containing protein n=2 Tax=Salmonella TaxID=590 RepID=UPI001F11C161|nr:DUF551 domain-containing protein [Salmonella enterica]
MTKLTKEQLTRIIESADDVLTAIAGTNDDIHPESDAMLRAWDELNDRHATPEVVREMARQLLASMEQEPVYQVWDWHWYDAEKHIYDEAKARGEECRVLYAAPQLPQPEVYELTAETLPDEIKQMPAATAFVWMYGWNACRAAMLQAGNSPVSPDGWIPVSDRMPPNKPGSYEYIVFDSLNNKAHHDYWNVPDGSCDDFSPFWNHYGKYVTHWMPLPAAPHFREIENSSTKHFRENEETSTNALAPFPIDHGYRPECECSGCKSTARICAELCWCRTCRPVVMGDMRFVVCPDCGNKRCPHANDHRNACTGSNEPGQIGSAYPAAPQQEVK